MTIFPVYPPGNEEYRHIGIPAVYDDDLKVIRDAIFLSSLEKFGVLKNGVAERIG